MDSRGGGAGSPALRPGLSAGNESALPHDGGSDPSLEPPDRPLAAMRTLPLPGNPLRPSDPRELGGYELLARLGEGGMGTVYLGRSPAGRRVAVKVVRAELADDPEYRARFRREAEVAQRVARYCTAEVLDAVDPSDGPPYLVTEFVDGPSLAETVAAHGPLGSADVERLAVSVASAMAVIHAAGLVHRDLKPSNVLLSQFGPRVIDFGVAWAPDSVTVTRDLVVGTPAFMAPEQARGERVTAAADVFAWGGLMIFAATGRRPFGGGAVPTVLFRIVNSDPDLDGVDESLTDVVRDAMRRDPAERPTAGEIVSRLQTLSPTRGIVPVTGAAYVAASGTSQADPVAPLVSTRAELGIPAARAVSELSAAGAPDSAGSVAAAAGPAAANGVVPTAGADSTDSTDSTDSDPRAMVATGDDNPTIGSGPVLAGLAGDGEAGQEARAETPAHLGAGGASATGDGPGPSGRAQTDTVVLRGGQARERTAETLALAGHGDAEPRERYAEAPTTTAERQYRDEVSSRRRRARHTLPGRLPWTTLISAFSVLVALVAVGVAARAALERPAGRAQSGVLAASELTVPGDLVGLTAADAEKRLRAAGFNHVRREMTPNIKVKGTVLQVRPGGDSQLEATETITLVVSAGLESIRVPEVVGLTESAARGTLQDAGLTVVVRTSTGPAVVGPGRVAAVNPVARSEVAAGSTVTITVIVPSGTRSLAKMPDVVGQPADQAQTTVRAAGFTDIALDYAASSAAAGMVTATDPPAGGSTAKNATVTLTVSTGPGHTTVNDVAGRPEAEARAALEAAGLVVTVRYDTGPSGVGPGLVETVDPVSGSQVALHSKVTITVVSTQVTVPYTVNSQRAQAEKTLNSYGLDVVVVRQTSDQPVGTVLAQTPESGTVRRGSSVTLTVAKAPDAPSSPGSTTGPPATVPPTDTSPTGAP
ncbi:PASTA domain-containing protein [Pseudofrankia sp. BMG5.37]|uniref:PASTA domain-containing protein n=1 Tax=Pseudofrankia sp. BMG5.37 TaxID=3050035 RepID=UPI002893921F|nr:PASTA domain-containing protein [Pseudofrankia sp. BMG5.37]MDT3443680.1 PASTA domain-containing protein [Pseudofrankia sp. BMG5.37]